MRQPRWRPVDSVPGVWRSPLPRAWEVEAFARDVGGAAVLDLTRRPRPVVERACAKYGLVYDKHGLEYQRGDLDGAVSKALVLPRPLLVHCFHGRDRTGLVARRLVMRTVGAVVLHRVGRNLNRAVRTCEALGIRRLLLHECDGSRVAGSLFKAAGQVDVDTVDALPSGPGVLALETGTYQPIGAASWENVHTLVIGGETSGLPRRLDATYATIPMCGQVSGLTVEAALAIALHEWRG